MILYETLWAFAAKLTIITVTMIVRFMDPGVIQRIPV